MKASVSMILLLLGCAAHAAEYDAIIRAARDGDLAFALPRLERLVAVEPGNARYLHDYVTVLHWAGRHADAIGWWPALDGQSAPGYALKALGASAHAIGDTGVALAAYTQAANQEPGDIDAHVGVARAHLDAGRAARAETYARSRLRRVDGRLPAAQAPLARVRALALEALADRLGAAAAYQDILDVVPTDAVARRRRLELLVALGMPHLAWRAAEESRVPLSPDERHRILHERAAREIQWGEHQLAVDHGAPRFAGALRGLAANTLALDARPAAVRQGGVDRTAEDRVVALRDGVRMAEARALYEALMRRGEPVADHARVAAADAYLYLEQPAVARDLYLRVIADSGRREPGLLFSLFYAHVECEEHDAAGAVADELIATIAPIVNKGMTGVELDNPDYPAALTTKGLQLIFADRLGPASVHLAAALARAPFNFGLRAAHGTLLASRDQPRASLAAFDAVLVDDPQNTGARIGRAENLLALKDYGAAGADLAALGRDYPEHRGVRGALDKLAVVHSPLLTLDTTIGRSPAALAASPSGARDFALDLHYYSAPIKEHYRVFGHLRAAEGGLMVNGIETAVVRDRIGMGIEVRRPAWEARAEVHAAAAGAGGGGIALSLTREFSDHWRARARFDSNTDELAWRAFFNGVGARAAGVDVTHTVHESRHFGAGWRHLAYSDGNRRNGATLWWEERWISGPIYKFTSTLTAGASRASLDPALAPYFNPPRDASVEATLASEWLTWRRYARSFTQRLLVGVGNYAQDGFATLAVASLRYEHEWTRDRRLRLRYGIGISRHPYDGVQQNRQFAFLNLAWSPPW